MKWSWLFDGVVFFLCIRWADHSRTVPVQIALVVCGFIVLLSPVLPAVLR